MGTAPPTADPTPPPTPPPTADPTTWKPGPNETPVYNIKYTKKWPHCSNVGACIKGSKCALEAACNAAGKECTGFSFTTGAVVGNGCLKKCGNAEFGGFGTGTRDYYAKGGYTVCKASECVDTAKNGAGSVRDGKTAQCKFYQKTGQCAKYGQECKKTCGLCGTTVSAEETQLADIEEGVNAEATWGSRRRRDRRRRYWDRRRRTPSPTKMPYPPIAAMSCGKVDLALVIDASGSVNAQQWEKQMSFAQALVKNMGISPSSVNAGIVMFGRTASTKIGLTSNAAALMPHLVNRNGVDTGATNMVAALDHADKMLKRGRSGVPKVMMMLTDGEPNRGGNPDANFAAMKAAGTSVMMVLIGPGISSRRAKNWGSTPPISISSFTALSSAFTTISKEFCSVAKEAVKKAKTPAPTIAPPKIPTSCECHMGTAVIPQANAASSTMAEPADPCKKYQDEKKADKAVAAALKSEIRFGGGSTVIQSSGFTTLDKVAKILKQYPWMKIEVEAHSDAGAGSICDNLTKGRAASTEKYLRSKGVTNLMGKPVGKCGVKRAIVIASSGGRSSAPAGCKM